MKRQTLFNVILLLLITIIFAISCSPSADIGTSERLILISNVDKDENVETRSLESEDILSNLKIKGVLLKYHSEGLYSRNSYFSAFYDDSNKQFRNPNAFYLEYLGKIEETHYGMEFNYVLYVPEVIKTTYAKGNGKNPKSGNPFWWYMQTYYGKDMNMIRSDWPSALLQLFLNKDGLVMPNSKDVKGSWNGWNTSNSNNNESDNLISDIGNYYLENERSQSPETFMYFKDAVRTSKKNEQKAHIIMPSEVRYIYFSGSGIDSNYDSLIWYFETYYKVKKDDLLKAYKNGTIGTLFEECYKKYGYIEPKPTDVNTILNVVDVTRNIDSFKDKSPKFKDARIYRAGILIDESGAVIEDCDRIYFEYFENENRVFIYLPEKYVEQMKEYCKKNNKKFSYNGNLIWNYLNDFCGRTREEGEGDNKYVIQGKYIECLANYRASEGFKQQ